MNGCTEWDSRGDTAAGNVAALAEGALGGEVPVENERHSAVRTTVAAMPRILVRCIAMPQSRVAVCSLQTRWEAVETARSTAMGRHRWLSSRAYAGGVSELCPFHHWRGSSPYRLRLQPDPEAAKRAWPNLARSRRSSQASLPRQ